MSTKNKKSVASQALLEMDEITSVLKEESKKSLNLLLAEAVKDALREGCDEEKDDEKDYEVIDDEKKDSADKKKKSPKKSEDEAGNPNDMMGQNGDEQPVQQPDAPNPQMGAAEMTGGKGPEQMNGSKQGQGQAPQDEIGGGEDFEGEAEPEDGASEEGWDEFSDYQVGDGNTYDLTGENDYDTVVKVYKLLNDDDQVVVKKDDNIVQLKDNEAGTEYVIDLGEVEDEGEPEEMEGEEEMPRGLNESFDDDDFAGVPEDEGYDDEDDWYNDPENNPYEPDDIFDNQEILDNDFDESDFGDEYDDESDFGDEYDDGPDFGDEYDDEPDFGDEYDDEPDFGDDFEDDEMMYESRNKKINKKNKKPMRESKNNVLFEVDLGYTDNYQDKDPIAGLSNNEPAKGKKSWHKGVPTGTAKPWAGDSKSKGDPFKTTQKVQGSVNEEDTIPNVPNVGDDMVDEANLSQSRWNDTHANANRIPAANEDEYRRKEGMKKTHKGTQYRPVGTSSTNESKEIKAIKNENKELKKAVVELRKSLNEAYITNVNLGKITKLFLENATSQKEKIEIVNRFANEAKTLEQSKMLYESIDKELKKSNKQTLNLNESSVTANGTKALNEQKIYKSDDLLKTINFMNRVLDC